MLRNTAGLGALHVQPKSNEYQSGMGTFEDEKTKEANGIKDRKMLEKARLHFWSTAAIAVDKFTSVSLQLGE